MRSALALSILTVAGCGLLEPDREKRPGILILGPDEVVALEAPDTVDAGERFTVRFSTYGLNGCYSAAETALELDEARAVLTPFDYRIVDGDISCAAAIVRLRHEATFAFSRAGEAVIEIHGSELGGSEAVLSFPIAVREIP